MITQRNPNKAPSPARLSQLERLSSLAINGSQSLIHGSVAHAVLMGQPLPSDIREDGSARDIDLYVAGSLGKNCVEQYAHDNTLDQPCPVDAGLCGLLIREGQAVWAHKDGVAVELKATDPLEDTRAYNVMGADGIIVNSFGPTGLLAVDRLEPARLRPGHIREDWQLAAWFRDNDVRLPTELNKSIEEFHRAYKAAYPHGEFLEICAMTYVALIPESIRAKLRSRTHRMMKKHAGRVTPYSG